MSDSHLPDDLTQWPHDPFAVLGVRRGVGPRELRKAYTNLIRVFKPEHRPDHFRRIREAFETIQRYAAFFQPGGDPEPPPGPQRDIRISPVESRERGAPEDAPRAAPVLVSVDDLWNRAVRGETVEAYRAFVAESDRSPGRAELYARLYWLAAVEPEVDPHQPAAEWLTRGLSATGLSGVLLELYGAELLDNPAEALMPRASRLLAGNHSARELAAYARIRWQALARSGQWSAIRDEFDRVRDPVRRDDEAAWLWLASDLVTWIAWGRQNNDAVALARSARTDIRALEHLALRHAAHFDQLDWLDAVARSCQRLRDAHYDLSDFVTVLRDSWLLPPELLRRPLEDVLAAISAEPVAWLERFDEAGPEALAALSQFGNVLGRYQSEADLDAESPHPPGVVRSMAESALRDADPEGGRFRARALRFCLDEAVDPGIIRTAFHPHLGGPARLPGWVVALAEDAPLHHICWACRLFRA